LSLAVREETEMPDADKARRQHMQEKSAQELARLQSHLPFAIAMCGVPPAKSDFAVCDRQNSMIGDRDAVGVTRQIAQDLFGASERRFGVDHPIC